jgi:hypothetical protein
MFALYQTLRRLARSWMFRRQERRWRREYRRLVARVRAA